MRSLTTGLKVSSSCRCESAGLTLRQVVCGIHLVKSDLIDVRPTEGASMYPTLSTSGDIVLSIQRYDKLNLERGEIVTALSPHNPSYSVCKRVIGLEGDSIYVPSSVTTKAEYVVVPRGHVWLAGDNTSNSTDSREYGPVPIAMLRGKVIAVVRSFPSLEQARIEAKYDAQVWPKPRFLKNNFTQVTLATSDDD